MVRRGSTVRVRQRAYLERKKPLQKAGFCCLNRHPRVPPSQGGDRRSNAPAALEESSLNQGSGARPYGPLLREASWGQVLGTRIGTLLSCSSTSRARPADLGSRRVRRLREEEVPPETGGELKVRHAVATLKAMALSAAAVVRSGRSSEHPLPVERGSESARKLLRGSSLALLVLTRNRRASTDTDTVAIGRGRY